MVRLLQDACILQTRLPSCGIPRSSLHQRPQPLGRNTVQLEHALNILLIWDNHWDIWAFQCMVQVMYLVITRPWLIVQNSLIQGWTSDTTYYPFTMSGTWSQKGSYPSAISGPNQILQTSWVSTGVTRQHILCWGPSSFSVEILEACSPMIDDQYLHIYISYSWGVLICR